MKAIGLAATMAIAALASGCATGPTAGPVDVTRFHLNAPFDRGTFVVEPLRTNATISPEYQTYAAAVVGQMQKLGFSQAAGTSQYIASVSFLRASRGFVQRRSPVSVGIGAGGGGFGRRGGVGVGGGVGFPIGGGGAREVIGAELAVQIRRRVDNTVIWEGRAVTDAIERTDAAQPIVQAERLADALFRNFPGESGITTTVR